jgi:AraC-like DNA-binding protein
MNIYVIPPLLSLIVSAVIISIALFKGRLQRENIVFIAQCLCWSLLSPIFLAHQIFRGDIDLIIRIERSIHIFYAFSPAVSLLYYYTVAGIKSRYIVRSAFIISFLFSLTTQSEYYIYGLHEYSWGYMAKGGISFIAFGFFAAIVLIYVSVSFLRRIKAEENRIVRLKLKYIVSSFCISALLTLMNYPAIVGIDFYPVGNFSFIPLAFIAYGVLKYRLIDFSSMFQITTVWAAISAMIAVPNLVIFYYMQNFINSADYGTLFVLAALCFFLNYQYFRRVQPLIDRFLNREKLRLRQLQINFIDKAYSLRLSDELINEFTGFIKQALAFDTVTFRLYRSAAEKITGDSASPPPLSKEAVQWVINLNSLIDRDIMTRSSAQTGPAEELLRLFEKNLAAYILPLIYHGEIIALVYLPEKPGDSYLTPDEISFLKNIKYSASVSLANSLLYSDLAELKNSLEVRVKERTAELESSMNALSGVIDKLKNEDKERVVSYFTRKKLDEAVEYIEKNFREEITRESIAEMMNLNSDYLGRSFKKITGRNINDYINDLRIKKACELLSSSDETIIDIAFESGFESLPTFYRIFKKFTGEPPVNYRQKYKKTESVPGQAQ